MVNENCDPIFLFICFIRDECESFDGLQAGIAAAPARAVSAVKEMNIPQRIKDIKLPDLPSIGSITSKF